MKYIFGEDLEREFNRYKKNPQTIPYFNPVNLDNIIIELTSKSTNAVMLKDDFINEYTYNKHEERLIKYGWDRDLTPTEAFNIFYGFLKRDKRFIYIAEDMMKSEGEFTSYGMKKMDYSLIIYEGLTHLEWSDENKHYQAISPNFFTTTHIFLLDGISNGWNRLEDISIANAVFVEYLFGRTYHKLPEEFRIGPDKSWINIPNDENIWPMVISRCGKYNIGFNIKHAVSRGVRKNILVNDNV